MDNYAITIDWSAKDQAYIAEAPELPGCAADGASRQEALTNLEIVMREWIETATELNRPTPQPCEGVTLKLTAKNKS